jgi:hypothetical protein
VPRLDEVGRRQLLLGRDGEHGGPAAEEDTLDAELVAVDELLDEERAVTTQQRHRGGQPGGLGDQADALAAHSVTRLDHPGAGGVPEEADGLVRVGAQPPGGLREPGGGQRRPARVLGAHPADGGRRIAGQPQGGGGLGDGDLRHLPHTQDDVETLPPAPLGEGPVGGVPRLLEADR